MLRRLIQWGNSYFNISWRVIPFQPVLYMFVFGASIRLWLNQTEPPNFDLISHDFYNVWLGLGAFGPLLALFSWFLIEKGSGTKTFMGLWFRVAADISVFTALLSYHFVVVQTYAPTESRIFARYIVGASTFFVILLVIRDIWTLVVLENLAARIHRGDDE